jgi:hypothetical protein
MVSPSFFWFFQFVLSLGFAAIRTLSINHNTGAGTVRTKNPALEIESIIIFSRICDITLNKMGATFQTINTFQGNKGFTMRAILSWDFFMTIWAFHSVNQLFLEVNT